MYSEEYLTYTTFLTIFPVGTFILIILQLFADKYGHQKINDKTAKILLYGVYTSAFACSCLGYSLHVEVNPLWCRFYGLPPCFGMLGATKGCLYAFFLRRAKTAHVGNIISERRKKLLFDQIGPLYIFIYWVIYVILAAAVFTGRSTETNENDIITRCLFDSWKWWFVIFANGVDLFNCVATLMLFLIPLIKSINRLKTDDTVNDLLLKKFIAVMKWNVILSFIATISSVVTLVSIPIVGGYIWFFCAGDPFVNSICVFMMMASNRTFMKNKCCICQTQKTVENKLQSHKLQSPKSVNSMGSITGSVETKTNPNTKNMSNIMIVFGQSKSNKNPNIEPLKLALPPRSHSL